jgi:hypothetical protein
MPTVIIHCCSMVSEPRRSFGAYSAMYAVAMAESAPMATPISVRDEEHRRVRPHGGQDRAGGVDPGVHDQQLLAAEEIGGRAGQDGARGGPQRGSRHQVPQRQAVQPVGDEVQSGADVGRVIAEQEATQRGQQC